MELGFRSDHKDGILTIRFVRREIRSPLSIHVIKGLSTLLDQYNNSIGLKGIVFTGDGDVFASGADLREVAQVLPDTTRKFAADGQQLMSQIASISVKTVAAVNGYCFGGALDLALACDVRIASPNALFAHPGASLGIITGWGGTQRLPRLIGETNALEMFFTARRFDAQEALRIGLIDDISEDPLAAAKFIVLEGFSPRRI